MTNLKVGKQLFPRSAFIGFDHLFNELEYATKHANDHYPPHNTTITLAKRDGTGLLRIPPKGFDGPPKQIGHTAYRIETSTIHRASTAIQHDP